MESSGTGIGRLDCYEDMFKEITRKLYGDDPDHRTSNVQNEFEASVTFKAEEPFKTDEDEAATQASDDATSWLLGDEPLKGTDGSRIAAYRAATSTWRCYECGDCMAGGAHEVAEHFIDLHAPRYDDGASRGRMHRKDYLGPSDFKLEEIVAYLEKVRERADRLGTPPTRRTQETQTVPAVLLPVTPNFLLQELPSTPPQQLLQHQPQPQQQHQQPSLVTSTTATRPTTQQSATNSGSGGGGGGGGGNNSSGKRYTCLYCPYGTDRRDLYTRHENIHREEKPFHCYVCCKPFSRADHVKKHFLRMHREHTYELSRIRRSVGSSSSLKPLLQPPQLATSIQPTPTPPADVIQHQQQQQQQQQQQHQPVNIPNAAAIYQAATNISSALVAATATATATAMASPASVAQSQPAPRPATVQATQQPRRSQNAACKTQLGKSSSSKNQERRYTCCYCSWSGVDNWCLKRHLNTHLKPFACALCEYKAARAERLATHVLKVHNRRQCSRCSFLAEDLPQLQVHQLHVHRSSNQGTSAAAPAPITTAPVTPQQQTPATIPQQQSQSNEQHQIQSLNGGGGGRAPPGPPVFPASSAAIAPATTVIPPTTILGDRASMPGSGCWEQEASSCEARFHQAINASEPRRSRKQSTPRKVTATCFEIPDQPTEIPVQVSRSRAAPKAKLFKCYQCPKRSIARAKAYHSRASLLLHKMWRHKANRPNRRRHSVVPITLRASLRDTQPA